MKMHNHRRQMDQRSPPRAEEILEAVCKAVTTIHHPLRSTTRISPGCPSVSQKGARGSERPQAPTNLATVQRGSLGDASPTNPPRRCPNATDGRSGSIDQRSPPHAKCVIPFSAPEGARGKRDGLRGPRRQPRGGGPPSHASSAGVPLLRGTSARS
jgi:hypothetical protein